MTTVVHWCHLPATSLVSVGLLFPTQGQQQRSLLRVAFYSHFASSAQDNSNFFIYVEHNLPLLHYILGPTELPSLKVRYIFSQWVLQIFQKFCIISPF